MRLYYDIIKTARENGKEFDEDIKDEILSKLVKDEKTIKEKNRYMEGYAAEELFRRIYCQLPWIKVITPLGQEQYPEKSKESLQVPDYKVVYEVQDEEHTETILVEVKLVNGDKETFKLQKYKFAVLKKYAIECHMPLVFAIYWKEKRMWTVNHIDAFSEKNSQYKLSFGVACKNDLSAIFGDYTYIFKKNIYRKSIYEHEQKKSENKYYTHEKYGAARYEALSLDNINYEEVSVLETAMLDSCFDFSNDKIIEDETELTLIESSKDRHYIYKLSSILMAYLQKIHCYNNEDMFCEINDIVSNAFNIVDTVRRNCGGERYYSLPNKHSIVVDELIKKQFGNTHIYADYMNIDIEDNQTLLCRHI